MTVALLGSRGPWQQNSSAADRCGNKLQAPAQAEEHPHQDEKWYQKWLPRQANTPKQIIEIGGSHQQEKQPEAKPEEQQPSEVPAHQGQQNGEGYENEELYQKWISEGRRTSLGR